MKLWFHSAPLWNMEKFPAISRERKKKIRPITSMSAFSFCLNAFKTTRFLDDPSRRGGF